MRERERRGTQRRRLTAAGSARALSSLCLAGPDVVVSVRHGWCRSVRACGDSRSSFPSFYGAGSDFVKEGPARRRTRRKSTEKPRVARQMS